MISKIMLIIFICLIICLIIWLNIRLINYKNLTTEIVGQNILPFESEDQRFEYYVGALINDKAIKFNFDTQKGGEGKFRILSGLDNDIYIDDLRNISNICNITIKLPYVSGDTDTNFDHIVLSKSRPSLNNNILSNNVLLPLENKRHMSFAYDIINKIAGEQNTNDKSDKLVWRGTTTGNDINKVHNRFTLVNKYFKENWCDIGFSSLCQDKYNYKKLVKNEMSQKKLLDHKYLLCIEGNDVASSAKWMLASNSVVLSPRFTIETWYAEGKLIPYVHYVPINPSFDDLRQKYEWCVANPEKCKIIADNATQFVKYFCNEDKENKMIQRVINKLTKEVKLKEFQNDLKELMKLFDEFCDEISIEYWAHYGTLLGAVRNKNIIFHDDDLDVGMTRNDYNILINNENIAKKFGLKYKYRDDIPRVILINFKSNTEPYLDIFIMENINGKFKVTEGKWANLEKGYFTPEELYPLKEYKFDTFNIKGPNISIPFLEREYGDWEIDKKTHSHHNFN
mgnify:CR=1 FL=1